MAQLTWGHFVLDTQKAKAARPGQAGRRHIDGVPYWGLAYFLIFTEMRC
jgi:hypothetical protein